MANVPEDLHYSKDHEWVRVEGDQAVIGITDYAQDSLGDVVYVELPKTYSSLFPKIYFCVRLSILLVRSRRLNYWSDSNRWVRVMPEPAGSASWAVVLTLTTFPPSSIIFFRAPSFLQPTHPTNQRSL